MGLTSEGFEPKSLQDIRDDISDNLKIRLGNDIDTTESSRIGQFIDTISSELNSVWLGLQDTYNSLYPDSASGTSLDNVVAITNTARLRALPSQGDTFIGGDVGTSITAGSLIQKTGTDERFLFNLDQIIVDTTNLIYASDLPTAGDITLSWEAEAIAPIEWNDTAVTIKSKLEAHSKIDDVTITGTFNDTVTEGAVASGAFHIEFVNDTLVDRTATIDVTTLTRNSEDLDTATYFSTTLEADVTAANTGEVTVPVRSLTTIATPVVGWDVVLNFQAGITGRARETDAELRVRRATELQQAGAATLNGMRQSIENVANVVNVTLIENDTEAIDVAGRPPHSVEPYVSGGDDDAVAQAIYDSKPIGIGIASTSPNQRMGDFTDVNEDQQTMTFSEPVNVPMLIVVNITVDNAFYPVDGADQIKNALLAFFSQFELGQDVLNHELYTPVNTVPGLITVQILQDTVAGGVPAAANTPIAISDVATLEFADITVNEL